MNDIIHAWKNQTCGQGRLAEEQTMLPANPSGEIELTDAELETVCGADGRSFAPVSDMCLQSILLGMGHCETLG